MSLPLTLADGQLPSSAASLQAGSGTGLKVSGIFSNTGGSSETVSLYVSRNGGTNRKILQAVLATGETLIVNGINLASNDTLLGVATDASVVDYVLSHGTDEFEAKVLDANGALKSGSAAFSGDVSLTGDLVVGGGDIDLGSSGVAGTADIFPATASKGKTQITATANSGNTTTTITNAAMAAARTLTIPDPGSTAAKFLLSAQTQGATGLFAAPLKLLDVRNTDGSTLAAAASAGKFGCSITLGTSFALVGEVSNNNTKTDDAIIEYVLPATYIAGQNLTVTVNAAITTAGSPTYAAKTVQVLAYRTASDGSQGADIGPGSASAITIAGADVTFTVTGTTLNPGDKLVLKLETVLHDTGAVNCNTVINSVRVS